MTPLHPRLRPRLSCLIVFICFQCQAHRAHSSDSGRCHLGSASKMGESQLLIHRSEVRGQISDLIGQRTADTER